MYAFSGWLNFVGALTDNRQVHPWIRRSLDRCGSFRLVNLHYQELPPLMHPRQHPMQSGTLLPAAQPDTTTLALMQCHGRGIFPVPPGPIGNNREDGQWVQVPRLLVAKFSAYPPGRIFALRSFGSCTTASMPCSLA